jgi:Protein of unknown function (DUF2608)
MCRMLLLSSLLFLHSVLMAEIREIDRIDDLILEADPQTFVFIDIDETLIESPIMLGGKAWRRYVREVTAKIRTPEEVDQIHDKLTLFIANRVPYVPVEHKAPASLQALQEKNKSVFCLTARGREHWYDLPGVDGEELGVAHLKQAGFDFGSFVGEGSPLLSHPSYARGVFFAYPIEDKGELMLELFSKTDFRPSKVVFADDKMSHVKAVQKALDTLGIPSVCFYYAVIDKRRPFDPLTAYIQLEKLVFEGKVLSDQEAVRLMGDYMDKNPDELFLELIPRVEEAI